jgi:hypothetical protein
MLSRVPTLPQKNTNIYELVLDKLQKYKIIKMKVLISGTNINKQTRKINITYIDIHNNSYKNTFSNYGYSPYYSDVFTDYYPMGAYFYIPINWYLELFVKPFEDN